ncbi:hypothetical protein HZU77_008790 [Neisseriaceae bacterium TC5R-5]|nr:hypothetical protein [Neisseriaceae bacterium TC5R-5]
MKLERDVLIHWLRLDQWSTREASLILLGFHPETMKGSGINISNSKALPDELQEVARLFQVFKRADWSPYGIRYFNGNLHPNYFIRMALDKQIEISPLLIELIDDQRKQHQEHEDDHAFALKAKERESLYKIIIGLAIGGYRYDPSAKRNMLLADMRKDIEKVGLTIDDDTLRKWLIKAASVLPPT